MKSTACALPQLAADCSRVDQVPRDGVPPPLRRIDSLHAQPGDAIHRAVPSLHGVNSTDGTAKQNSDPGMHWLDPDSVPTLGDWFRAGGYRTHYRGKWHVSFADLMIPGTHEGLKASDDEGKPKPRRSPLTEGRPARPLRVLGVDRP